MPLPADLGTVAAIMHAFDNVGLDGCGHPWVRPRDCIDCASHDLLWKAGLKEQGW